MPRDKQSIKRVVLYLRKSRDEHQEDALIKHRARLTRLCKKRNYQIVDVFEEIQSGKTLRKRPEMLRLLETIRTQNIEGIVVVEIDRLGRTDLENWGYVLKAFQEAKTFLITPENIYDPTDPNEAFILNIGSSLAHLELAKFSKRVKEGKIEGTILGKWTNGKPPYPYIYKKRIRNIGGKEITEGEVVVDEQKAKVYRMIIDSYLKQRMSTQKITMMLNRKQIPSPGGGLWHNNAVHRLLVDEFHLGRIIYGKVAGRHDKELGGGQIIKPRSEWIFSAEISHTPLKTQEEHDQIIFLLNESKRRPVASRSGKYPLSGLMYCEKCGHRMRFYKRTSKRSGKTHDYVKCDYYGPFGKTCNQMGAKLTEEFYQLILEEIRTKYINQERLILLGREQQALADKVQELSIAKDELRRKKEAKRRAEALYLEGIEDAEFYKQYKAKYDHEIMILESQIRSLERETNTAIPTEEELRAKGEEFFKKWALATTSKEKNILFSSIIRRVWYDRDTETGEIRVTIEYL